MCVAGMRLVAPHGRDNAQQGWQPGLQDTCAASDGTWWRPQASEALPYCRASAQPRAVPLPSNSDGDLAAGRPQHAQEGLERLSLSHEAVDTSMPSVSGPQTVSSHVQIQLHSCPEAVLLLTPKTQRASITETRARAASNRSN